MPFSYTRLELRKMPQDIVFIEDLRIDTIIGIYDWEREVKQTIALDVEMASDNIKPASTENIDDALNYKAVAKRLIAFTEDSQFQLVETLAERIEHLDRVRELQDETGGFTAFICWTFQPDNTDMADIPPAGAFEYLKTQAVSRLYLDNVPNIQSSWVTQGEKVGQMALMFGANDMGSLMIEENVVSQAGTVHHLSLETIRRCIRNAGYTPRQRNVFYEYIDKADEVAVQPPAPVLPILPPSTVS